MIIGHDQVYHIHVGYFNPTTQGPKCRMNVPALSIRFLGWKMVGTQNNLQFLLNLSRDELYQILWIILCP